MYQLRLFDIGQARIVPEYVLKSCLSILSVVTPLHDPKVHTADVNGGDSRA